MSRQMRRRYFNIVTVGLVLATGACNSHSSSKTGVSVGASSVSTGAKVVTLGVTDSLSGSGLIYAVPPVDALKLAVQELNKGGFKVGGTNYTFKLDILDDRSDGATNVANVQELVNGRHENIIFGPTLSALAGQAEAITGGLNVLEFSPSSLWQQNGTLTDPSKPNLIGLQAAPTQSDQSIAFALKQVAPNAKRIGLLIQDDTTGKATVQNFMPAFQADGREVFQVLYPPGTADLTPYLLRLKADNIDALFDGYPQNDVPGIANLASSLNVAPLFMSMAADATIGQKLTVPYIDIFVTPNFKYPTSPGVTDLQNKLLALDPQIPVPTMGNAFWTYDTVFMLAEAMTKAGSVDDVPAIVKAFGQEHYSGIAGVRCLDSKFRTIRMDQAVVVWQGGKVQATTSPSGC